MPVTATAAGNPGGCTDVPVLPGGKTPSPAAVSCAGQHVIATNNPREPVKGTPLLTKIRAFNIPGRRQADLEYQMTDVQGRPVDLRECLCDDEGGSLSLSSESGSLAACNYYVEFRLQEYMSRGNSDGSNALCVKEAEVVDAATGLVRVSLTKDDTGIPGVYFGSFALLEKTDDENDPIVIFTNTFYVHIGRDLYTALKSGDGRSAGGPPSIAEVRLHLRDTDPAESFLLDNLKFDDAEIAHATYLPVEEWNETPPPIGTYNTTNFPYRYHWLMAIAGHLFLIAAEHQRANNLTYAASGVSVNDMDKAPDYEQAATRRLEQWRKWMRHKKAEINLGMAYGGIGSPYRYTNY